ncbi:MULTISPECIES: amino acid ABC transporter substrate-binding protein [unclassified Bradyrhizobium]|uniref:amino acid ABC transporter substrate-binding protein n=1 Tax=unclassified Bradyrhizobium TaxID=2631580 RepID=UPI002479D74E|nr:MULTISPECIES: amino acid ABC transporter substrate-binding protein [unclassified Bradyrhizobium]WGR73330.1 amino acid ABC transporter substrate-binding protein [Bradyrhizobium sp. ISRA426]WGR78167.1 amino acid ABC transporter substrate-binding protein [Bradyrhizobium sp. ISRA430]WGR88568.1 amino acid ABC transporter substrate-binding protein [Bradyrhizobium sp. ISRA432]
MPRMFALLSATAITMLSFSTAQAGPTLDNIKSKKAITIGYREASIPFSYLGGDQKPVGFSLDLCAHIVDRLKADLSTPDLQIKLTPVNSSNRIPLIQNGTIDIECGGTASSKQRLEQVSFSVSTFASQTAWLAKVSSGFKTPKDLKGKTIVVTQGSDALGIAKSISQDEGLNLTIAQAKDHAESLLLLATGRASAWVEADILLAGMKADYSNPADLTFLRANYGTIYYYGLMFSKDDPDFKKMVDDVLSKLMASGEFTKIYDKWFMAAIPPKNINLNFPMTEALKERVTHPSDVVNN